MLEPLNGSLYVTNFCPLRQAGIVMTSVSALAVKAVWVVVVYASVVVLLLMLAGFAAVVDGHRPQHGHHASSGDHRGIHDSKVVQDAE